MSCFIPEYIVAKAFRQKQLLCQVLNRYSCLFLHVENEGAFTSPLMYLDVLAEKYTQSVTKKLPKWVSEMSGETRSHQPRWEWAELIAILIKIRGLPGPTSRNAFVNHLGRLPFASFLICITVKIPRITLYTPRDALCDHYFTQFH